jgi:hypothetical protein
MCHSLNGRAPIIGREKVCNLLSRKAVGM